MKGFWIPVELMDLEISWTKRILLAEISQLEMLDKGCVASNSHFAQKLKLTTQAVSKALNELNKEGLINIDNAHTKRNFGRTITINFSKSGINFSKSGINFSKSPIHESGESKENKQDNNTIQEKNLIKKEFSFTLNRKTQIENTSKEYQEKLREYIESSGKQMSYEDFYNSCVTHGYKYKNFKLAYDKWNSNTAVPTRQNNQQPHQQQKDPFDLYRFYRQKGMAREVAETRVISETGLKYPATDRFLKAVASAEFEWHKQQAPRDYESDEEYIKRLLGDL